MKTKPKTRVSFSDNPPTIDVTLPTKWTDLSQDELRTVFRVLDMYTDKNDSVEFEVFRRLAHVRIERHDGDRFLCCFKTGKGRRAMKYRCWVTPGILAEFFECLYFLHDPGSMPVRLEKIGSGFRRHYAAVNAQLHNVCFRDYVKIENLYQGFLRTNDVQDIAKMAALLYPGFDPAKDRMQPYEAHSILQWLVQVKALFARVFKNFFRPVDGTAEAPKMVDVLNNEIRALTQGDVTKEAEIFEIDCWRALTELDFKAREAEEFNRAKNKHR